MREIKFRAWDERQQGYTPYPIAISNDGVIKFLESVDQWIDTNYIPEQYTGLKDKNGKEIYEGDITKVDSDIYYVEWRGAGDWFIDPIDNSCFMFTPSIYELEVIGNIHENPELLNA